MDEFEVRTLQYIRQHRMLQKGDTVIAAVSGGADSTALLRMLLSCRDTLGICLRAAHVNHALRGKAADEDEAFVRKLCARYGVPLDVIRLTPPKKANEEWARNERYVFFNALSARCGAKIATAHTACDNAETVLFRLARGTAARGAAGIPPVRGGFFRPLLWAERKEIIAYLKRCSQEYVTDATNETDDYARNRIRHGALPSLEQAHEGAVQNIVHFAAEMADVSDFLENEAQSLLKRARAEEKIPGGQNDRYDAQILAKAPAALRKAALRRLIASAAPQQKTSLVGKAEELLFKKNGAIQLCSTAYLAVRQGMLSIEDRDAHGAQGGEEWQYPLKEGIFKAPDGIFYKVSFLNYEKRIKSEKDEGKPLNFCADYGKIQKYSVFRTRRAKDRYRPKGRGVSKTLKDFFTEQKVPLHARAILPVLACESTVLWAAGFGFAEGTAPDETTKIAVTIEPQQTEELK